MYCSNCGLQLPDWAHYCERCGARLERPATKDDPLAHVGLDDTSAHEPLWPAHSRGIEEEEPADQQMRDLQTEPLQSDEYSEAHEIDSADSQDRAEVMVGDTVEDTALDLEGEQAYEVPEDEVDDAQVEQEPVAEEEPTDEPAPEAEPEASNASEDEKPAESAGEDESNEGEEPSSLTQEMDPAELEDLEDETSEAEEKAAGEEPADGEGEVSEDEAEHDGATEASDAEGQQEYQAPTPQMYIDVGEQDGPIMVDSPVRHRVDTWQGRQRPSERRASDASMSMKALAIAAAAAIMFGFFIAFILLGGSGSTVEETDNTAAVTHKISKNEASEAIKVLDGWWTTDRTFDGRYWHIQDGLMETYAADGQLAKQELIDPDYVERMDVGPGGIEGVGYYFRDIAFYLMDGDSNTMHAINGDGTAYEEANLFRSDPPAFMGTGETSTVENVVETADASEYMLPESNVRVYDVSELESLSDHDLFVARNEIYARHGYVFEAGELSEYFSSKSWYHPSDVFNEGDISEIERQNVSTILSLEHSRGSQYV